MSININSNFSELFGKIVSQLVNFDTDAMLKEQASTAVAMLRNRVHNQGLASDSSQIGTYAPSYMIIRTQKGGVIPTGADKGKPRPVYNRTSDNKVVLSLTRQMEQDLSILPIEKGYGVGYNNNFNLRKSLKMEKKYGKTIFKLSAEEIEIQKQIAENYVSGLLR